MDKPPNYSYMEDPHHYVAVEIVRKKFRDGLCVPRMSRGDILADMELKKSAGTIEAWRGLRTKQDCLLAGVDKEYDLPEFLEEIPIWKVAGKVELRTRLDYIGRQKQRTFIIQPFGQYWVHKRVYGHQQERMKNIWWSAYGFNPYEGGTNRLARALNRLRRKAMGDVKGWDRLLPHMDAIYDIKNYWIDPSEEMEYATYHAINSRLHLPNGDVIEKTWGNNSGSGSTTIDNIVGMAICIAHTYLELGAPPEFIDECVYAALFGDDFVVADNLVATDEQVEAAYRKIFGLYGLELDPFVISYDLRDISFLGFTFEMTDRGYIPRYDLGRIAAPMLLNEERMTPEAEFAKMVSLMLMSAGNGKEVFSIFHRACSDVLYHSNCPAIKKFGEENWQLPSYEDVVDWYLGVETSSFVMDGGWDKVFYDTYGTYED